MLNEPERQKRRQASERAGRRRHGRRVHDQRNDPALPAAFSHLIFTGKRLLRTSVAPSIFSSGEQAVDGCLMSQHSFSAAHAMRHHANATISLALSLHASIRRVAALLLDPLHPRCAPLPAPVARPCLRPSLLPLTQQTRRKPERSREQSTRMQ